MAGHAEADERNARSRPTRNLTVQLDLIDKEVDVEPIDPSGYGFYITYGAFFFAGASTLAMWSAVILCLDFFKHKYEHERVGFVFPVVNMSALLVITLYMVVAGRQLPLDCRMNGSFVFYAVFIITMPIVNVLPLREEVAYALSIFSIVGATITSSIIQSTIYGLGGVFGPYFLQAIAGGNGFGAIVLFLIRLIMKWHYQIPLSVPAAIAAEQSAYNDKVSMVYFFIVALLLLIITWVLYGMMKRERFAQAKINEYLYVQHETPITSPLLSPLGSTSPRKKSFSATERSPLLKSRASQEEWIDPESSLVREEHANQASMQNVLQTAIKPFFSLFLSFFVCLTCFPGLISSIPSTTYSLGDWFPVILVGSYNFGDLVGKNLPVYKMIFDVDTLHFPWFLQLAYLPLFVLDSLFPFHDLVTVLLVFSFGILTGYVATCSMILAPSMCVEVQKEVAGMIASLSAIIGLCAGAYTGLALETIITIVTQRQDS